VGGPLWLAGNALAVWSVAALGAASTSGEQGGLVRKGPYRISRNPQYVGFILGLLGWSLVSDSTLVLLAALAGILAVLLAPIAEEPWLSERFGEAYQNYCREVPRFL